jgi:hypothetical protein
MDFTRYTGRSPQDKRQWLIIGLVVLLGLVLAVIVYSRFFPPSEKGVEPLRRPPSPIAPLGS